MRSAYRSCSKAGGAADKPLDSTFRRGDKNRSLLHYFSSVRLPDLQEGDSILSAPSICWALKSSQNARTSQYSLWIRPPIPEEASGPLKMNSRMAKTRTSHASQSGFGRERMRSTPDGRDRSISSRAGTTSRKLSPARLWMEPERVGAEQGASRGNTPAKIDVIPQTIRRTSPILAAGVAVEGHKAIASRIPDPPTRISARPIMNSLTSHPFFHAADLQSMIDVRQPYRVPAPRTCQCCPWPGWQAFEQFPQRFGIAKK